MKRDLFILTLCLLVASSMATASTITIVDNASNDTISFLFDSVATQNRVSTGNCVSESSCFFTITAPPNGVPAVTFAGINLIEPGSALASDTLQQTDSTSSATFWQFVSDGETPLVLISGGSLTENGTAQLVATVSYHNTLAIDQISIQSDLDVPEPMTLTLLGAGLLGLGFLGRRRLQN